MNITKIHHVQLTICLFIIWNVFTKFKVIMILLTTSKQSARMKGHGKWMLVLLVGTELLLMWYVFKKTIYLT